MQSFVIKLRYMVLLVACVQMKEQISNQSFFNHFANFFVFIKFALQDIVHNPTDLSNVSINHLKVVCEKYCLIHYLSHRTYICILLCFRIILQCIRQLASRLNFYRSEKRRAYQQTSFSARLRFKLQDLSQPLNLQVRLRKRN